MSAVGDTLRRERQKRNLELDQISRELKISQKFLEAIEDDQFDKLPRGVFAKSFVRQYARLLGLDEDELAGEVQRAVEPVAAAGTLGGVLFTEPPPYTPSSEIKVPPMDVWEHVGDGRSSRSSSLPALALVVVVMLACSGLYAWWQRTRHPAPPHEEQPVAQVTPPPVAPPPVAPPVTQSVTPPVSQPQAAPPVMASNTPAATAPPETKPALPPSPPANPNNPVRIDVTAEELVWILARTDGKYSFSGTLEANQTRSFDAAANILLRLGNAGGVTIKLNGKPVGEVGPKGQVRTVQFTSGGFQIVAAPPKPSLPLEDLR